MAAAAAVCAGGRSRRPLPGRLSWAAVARFEYISHIIRTKIAELTGPRALIEATLPAYDPMTWPKTVARAGKAAGLAELYACRRQLCPGRGLPPSRSTARPGRWRWLPSGDATRAPSRTWQHRRVASAVQDRSWLSLVSCQHPMPSRDRRQPGHGRGRRTRAARSPCTSTRSDAGISPSACAGFRRYSTRGTGRGSPRTPRARRWWLRSSAAARPGPCTTRRQVFPVSSRRSRLPSALSTAALSSSVAIYGYRQPTAG